MRLWEYIKQKMYKNPEQTVSENGASMTFDELIMFAEMFAKKLFQEECCVIWCTSEMAAGMAILSCFAAGVTAVPMPFRYGGTYCGQIFDFIKPTAMITDTEGELKVLTLPKTEYKVPSCVPALIMCTSGTTGSPKGVMLSEENIMTNVNDISRYFKICREDRILIARSLFHSAVLTGEFLVSLVKGVNIQFYSEEFNPYKLRKVIKNNHISVLCGTPTMFASLAKYTRKEKMFELKTICISGECLSKEVGLFIEENFPKAKIYHVYGLTEASPRVSYLPPELFHTNGDSVGIALDSVFLKILKSDGQVADINESGTLWIKGGNVMLGYFSDFKLTKNVMRDGWLCTKDIACIDEKGLLRIKGRSDELIIRAGMNIYPQEVEQTLKKEAKVRDALIYKIKKENGDIQIGLKIVGEFTNTDEVKKMCVELLPSFQVPAEIYLVEQLPKTPSGKLVRRID